MNSEKKQGKSGNSSGRGAKWQELLFGLATFLATAGFAAVADGMDHMAFDVILKEYVSDQGAVDYARLVGNRKALDDYVGAIGAVEKRALEAWPREEQIAFYINAYNAITLVRILDHYPPRGWGIRAPRISVRNIRGVWTQLTNRVAGEILTLDDIEHKVLRAKYQEPRIHAAIVCASVGCPRLARDAYTGARLEEQLDRQAKDFTRDSTKNSVDVGKRKVTISPIFKWFKEDFEAFAGEVPAFANGNGANREYSGGVGFIARHAEPEKREFLRTGDYAVKVGEYDWSLNGK